MDETNNFTEPVRFRVSKEQKKRICELSQAAHMTESALLRALIDTARIEMVPVPRSEISIPDNWDAVKTTRDIIMECFRKHPLLSAGQISRLTNIDHSLVYKTLKRNSSCFSVVAGLTPKRYLWKLITD